MTWDFRWWFGFLSGKRHATIGSEGVGKSNSNGLLLLRKCAEHELLINNTVFRLPTRRKTTWMHPCSKHWHLIDYVIVRRKDRHDVRVTKPMCGADCWTDHRLVVSKLNLRIQPVRRPRQEGVKEIRCLKLKQDSKRQAFVNELCSRLDALEHSSEDVDESWTVFRDTVHSSAMDSLEPVSRKHQDCFDENYKEIQGLLEKKHQKHKAYLRNTSSVSSKTAYSNICKTVQTRLRDMQDSWLRKKSWWNPVLCRQKGHEKVLWCTQDSTWSPELRNHPTPQCRWI